MPCGTGLCDVSCRHRPAVFFRARQSVLSCLTAKMGIIIGLCSARGLELANITVQLCLGGGEASIQTVSDRVESQVSSFL